MSVLFGGISPQPSRSPVSRYAVSNPLRRVGGIRLLTYTLPEPLRALVVQGLRRPPRFDGNIVPFAIQSLHRCGVSSADLANASQRGKAAFVHAEVQIARRMVEAPQGSINRGTRNALLLAQGVELRRLYLALAAQIGQHAALALFQQALNALG